MRKPKIACESNKNDEIFSKIVQDSKEIEIKLPILGIKKRNITIDPQYNSNIIKIMKYQGVVNLEINMKRPIYLIIKLVIFLQKDLDQIILYVLK